MASTDSRPVPIKNTAYRVVFPIYDNTGALVPGAAGLDSEVSKDQGTFADCTNEATEIATSSGVYYLDLTSTEMNADCTAVIVKTSTTDAKTTVIVIYPQESGDIKVDVQSYGGTAGTFSGGRPEVNTTHAAGTAWASGAITAAVIADNAIDAGALAADCITAAKIADGAIDAATFAAGAINAAAIAADAITDAKVASDVTIASVTGAVGSVSGAVGSVTGNVGGNVVGSVASVVGAVGSVTGNVGGNVAGSVGSIASGGITTASFAAGAINAAAIAGDAITDAKVAADVTIASVTGAVGSVTGNVGGNVTGSVGSLATQAKADVNAEVVDALATDTYAEPSSVPAATASLATKIGWQAALARNKVTQTATTQTLRNDADSGNIATSTHSDDGTTHTRGEWA